MCCSGDVNVLQWNREWFFSRRVKFDSGFNVMAVFEVSWHGPEVIYRFTGIQIWVLRWWKWRPFWFSKKSLWPSPRIGWSRTKVDVLNSWSPPTNFTRPSATGKMIFPFFGAILLPLDWAFLSRFRCVHRFQLLNVCNHYVTLPNSHRVQSVSKE